MDINTSALASREMALNKAHVGQDILMKTLEKSAESKEAQSSDTQRPVERAGAEKTGRIDIYA